MIHNIVYEKPATCWRARCEGCGWLSKPELHKATLTRQPNKFKCPNEGEAMQDWYIEIGDDDREGGTVTISTTNDAVEQPYSVEAGETTEWDGSGFASALLTRAELVELRDAITEHLETEAP